MDARNDTSAYSRDKYKARRSSYMTTRSSSKYDEARKDEDLSREQAQAHDERRNFRPQAAGEKDQYDRSRYSSHNDPSASFSLSNGNIAALQHRSSKAPIIIAIIVVLAIAVAAWWFLFPKTFDITVNGQQTTVSFLTTVQDLVDDGYASPKPGDFVAVDGSIIEAGEGEPLLAKINDKETSDPKAHLSKNAVVTIEDGKDVEEEYEEVLEKVPFGKSTQEMTASSYYAAPIHVLSEGAIGSQSVRTGNTSGITVSTVLEEPIDEGFIVYSPDVGDDKVIALTFDDGPWPQTTREILSILKQNDAHATFFAVGEQCAENASIMKEVVAAGNQIATHSYDHANGSGRGVDMTLMSSQEQIDEIEKGFKAIEDAIGQPVTRIMRAPGGNYHGTLVTNLKPYVGAEIGWDVDSRDWTKPGVDAIVNQILTVKPGQIVLMHDGGGDRSQTVEALRKALPILKKEGYEFITIDELLSYGIPR